MKKILWGELIWGGIWEETAEGRSPPVKDISCHLKLPPPHPMNTPHSDRNFCDPGICWTLSGVGRGLPDPESTLKAFTGHFHALELEKILRHLGGTRLSHSGQSVNLPGPTNIEANTHRGRNSEAGAMCGWIQLFDDVHWDSSD